jgi:AcrR family transcriptional regulator
MRLFAEKAYDAVSFDEVATWAGVSKGLLYHYFADKRGYYLATTEAVAERLLAATEPPAEGPVEAALAAALGGFLDFVDAEGPLFRALVRGGIGSDPESGAIVERVRATSIARLRARAGLDGPLAPLERARLYGWIGHVEAVCLDWLEHRDLPREAIVDLLVATGLAAATPTGAPS